MRTDTHRRVCHWGGGMCGFSHCIHLMVVTPSLLLIGLTGICVFTQKHLVEPTPHVLRLPPFFSCAPVGDDGSLVLSSPVSSTRAARQAKAEASRFRLWRCVEKSRMESSHSPNPRRHWNLCSTKPLQNTSLSSDSIDLTSRKEEQEKKVRRLPFKIKAPL